MNNNKNKESPQTQAESTGNKDTTKYTKRKRITRYKLVLKWSQIPKICVLERSL
jgi:hypothetical protein